MRAEGYSLHLYCDVAGAPDHKHREFPHEFDALRKATAYHKARRFGWRLGRWDDICPKCVKAKRKPARGEAGKETK